MSDARQPYAPLIEDEEQQQQQPISPKLAVEVEDYSQEVDMSDVNSAYQKESQECCNLAICNQDNRSIDEYFSDIFCKPVVNMLISFFLEPINVSLTIYYVLGILLFRYLEGWTILEAAYFLTVTATTVGYGDYCPSTPISKLFTSIFCLYGLTVVGSRTVGLSLSSFPVCEFAGAHCRKRVFLLHRSLRHWRRSSPSCMASGARSSCSPWARALRWIRQTSS